MGATGFRRRHRAARVVEVVGVPLPEQSEKVAVWREFAISQGHDEAVVAKLSKSELIELVSQPAIVEPVQGEGEDEPELHEISDDEPAEGDDEPVEG